MFQFAKAFCDLGASINLMSFTIYKNLVLGEPSPTTIHLLMVDHTIKCPLGIIYHMFVRVEKFIFLANFVILDYEINVDVLIILGRSFLATGRALVDVESGCSE